MKRGHRSPDRPGEGHNEAWRKLSLTVCMGEGLMMEGELEEIITATVVGLQIYRALTL